MPRLDDNEIDFLWRIDAIARSSAFFIEINAPVDLCAACYKRHNLTDDVAHPPYNDLPHHCEICGKRLTDEEDN